VAERRDARWEVDSLYTEEQVDAVLSELGVRIQDDYADDFLGYCPFHGNNDTPSFAVSKQAGLYVCYNPACGVSGTFLELTMKIGKLNPFEAARLIAKNKVGTALSFEEKLAQGTCRRARMDAVFPGRTGPVLRGFLGQRPATGVHAWASFATRR
jgi:hypothetical protein